MENRKNEAIFVVLLPHIDEETLFNMPQSNSTKNFLVSESVSIEIFYIQYAVWTAFERSEMENRTVKLSSYKDLVRQGQP